MERPPKKKYPLHSAPFALSQLNEYCDFLEEKTITLDRQLNFEYDETDNDFRSIVYIDNWSLKTAKIRNKYIDHEIREKHKSIDDIIRIAIYRRLNKSIYMEYKSVYGGRPVNCLVYDKINYNLQICKRPYIFTPYNKIDILERFYKIIYVDYYDFIQQFETYDMRKMLDNYDLFTSGVHDFDIADLFIDQIYKFIKNLQNNLLKKHVQSLRKTHIMPMIIKMFEQKTKYNGKSRK